MTDHQIVLLPREEYWAWVRACRDYAMKYGVSLTPDPEAAARFMPPEQVVTVAVSPDGYPAQGDILDWFRRNHPAIRVDPIQAASPEELRDALAVRLGSGDRFGSAAKPFTLQWPTDYPVVEQPFGVNPDLYRRFNLPGHEGIDIRAPMNTNVYACEDGTVFVTSSGEDNHPYGIHVRVQHRDGYQTIYAHLARHYVGVDQKVGRGQKIAEADSTGNSTGSHLHLTLKKAGATAAGETHFPRDIIDPTPFLVWPGEQGPPPVIRYPWPPGKCLIGVHGRADGPLQEPDFAAIQQARVEAVKLTSSARPEDVNRLRQINPNVFVMVRLFADFRNRVVRSDEFAAWAAGDMAQFYERGVRYFEIHNEVNLQIEGWQRSWQNGREYGRWHMDVMGRLRAKFPEGLFGFPGLSPGADIPGQRADALRFLHQADEAVQASDWVGLHCYWVSEQEMGQAKGGKGYEEYRRRYPAKLLFITEFSNPNPAVDPATRGREYVRYYESVRSVPGLGAAFAFVVSASANFPHEVWRLEDGSLTEIPGRIGGRTFG